MKSCGVNVFLLAFICWSLGRKTCAAQINIDTAPDKDFIEELSLISEFSLVLLSDTCGTLGKWPWGEERRARGNKHGCCLRPGWTQEVNAVGP